MSGLLKAADSLLLIIDVQERLAPHVHEQDRVIECCEWLMGVAEVVGVSIMATEHYPEGIGHTVTGLRNRLSPEAIIEKDHFSGVSEPACNARIKDTGRNQIVIAGMEAHVCVMQTAIELKQSGKSVFVVAEGVSSRKPEDAVRALERMCRNGIEIVTREMVLFEWAHRGPNEQFRQLHRQFLKTPQIPGVEQ